MCKATSVRLDYVFSKFSYVKYSYRGFILHITYSCVVILWIALKCVNMFDTILSLQRSVSV